MHKIFLTDKENIKVDYFSKYELLCSLSECQFVCLICYARTNLNNTIYTWRNTRSDDLLLVLLRVETITPSCFLRNPLGPRVRLVCYVIVGSVPQIPTMGK